MFNSENLTTPWVESPFFQENIQNKNLNDFEKECAINFNKNGYIKVDLNKYCEQVSGITNQIISDTSSKYGKADRIQDLWRKSNSVKSLACNQFILDLLAKLYGRKAIPFQTLNFPIGTQQMTHSDTIHFNSVPERYMCGVWIALEDIDEYNGPLHYYPGSHKLPVYSALDIGFIGNKKTSEKNYKNYYEPFIQKLIKSQGLKKELATVKKGTAIIWAANLLHGGEPIKDPNRSRHSQVTHYFFKDCYYYQPLSSIPELNSIYYRVVYDISKNCFVKPKIMGKNIRVPLYQKIRAFVREAVKFTPQNSSVATKYDDT